MKGNILVKILMLLTVSLITVAFAYQCHPVYPSSQEIREDRPGKPMLLKLEDIKEGALVRKIDVSGFYRLLPQLETKVQIHIEGMVASTTVDQVFTNELDEPIEAVYVFPLPQNAAVHDMKMLNGTGTAEYIHSISC
jgi:Ca-activated chloride channel family protein